MDKLVIVIPAYQESENLLNLINNLESCIPGTPILIVDDSADDLSVQIVNQIALKNVRIVHRKQKMGRGSAVIFAMNLLLNQKFKYLLEMDADFSHSPQEILNLLTEAETKNADLVIASRYVNGSEILNWPKSRRFFSKLANASAKFVVKVPVSDYTNGFRIYSRRAVEIVEKECGKAGDGFILLTEIIMRLNFRNLKIIEVKTQFVNRTRGESSLSLKEIFSSLIGLYKISLIKRRPPK